MAKVFNCDLVVREFELQSWCYVYFQTNTLGESMNPLSSPRLSYR